MTKTKTTKFVFPNIFALPKKWRAYLEACIEKQMVMPLSLPRLSRYGPRQGMSQVRGMRDCQEKAFIEHSPGKEARL